MDAPWSLAIGPGPQAVAAERAANGWYRGVIIRRAGLPATRARPFADMGHCRAPADCPHTEQVFRRPCAPTVTQTPSSSPPSLVLRCAARRELISHRSRFHAHSSVSNNAPFFFRSWMLKRSSIQPPLVTLRCAGGWALALPSWHLFLAGGGPLVHHCISGCLLNVCPSLISPFSPLRTARNSVWSGALYRWTVALCSPYAASMGHVYISSQGIPAHALPLEHSLKMMHFWARHSLYPWKCRLLFSDLLFNL